MQTLLFRVSLAFNIAAFSVLYFFSFPSHKTVGLGLFYVAMLLLGWCRLLAFRHRRIQVQSSMEADDERQN